MPLPTNGADWPPAQLAPLLPKIREWRAWWVGTPEALEQAYGAARTGVTTIDRPAQYRGGITGLAARMWWGTPVGDLTSGSARDRTHIPVARSIARASSKSLYAEPPSFAFPEPPKPADGQTKPADPYEATAQQVAQYVEDGLHTDLASGAEVGAALGGRYHRVTWDGTLLPRPFLVTVHPDNAVPEFKYDRLRAVTFWWVLPTKNTSVVMRHLERHELDAQGNGVVLHGLYQGTGDSLGRVVPLTEHPATAGLADVVGADGALVEGRTPGLCVEYIPNRTPAALWSSDPLGKSFGSSDYDGIEGLMDNLDEAWSAWMRDVRQSKGRLIVPDTYLDDNGPGKGASFDMDREVFTGLPGVLGRPGEGLSIEKVQFTVPVEQHGATTQELEEKIFREAGYSAATFGEANDGGVTATEIRDRRTLTNETKNAKARIEKAAVARLVQKMLLTDQAVFNAQGLLVDVAPVVDFDDGIHESPQERADQALSLFQSQSASAAERVRSVHPEWDDIRVDAEVAAIGTQFGYGPLADPADPALFGN